MTTWTYETIKELARSEGVKVADLIALAPQNDPFYTGTDGDWSAGRWFADLWARFGYTTGVHIRRVHYQVISQDPPVNMPDGTPYENTERCWKFINQASKQARYLGLVDPGAFVDRRNPDPRIFAYDRTEEPQVWVYQNLWSEALALPPFPDLPSFEVHGYTGIQRYHVEIWCEKSTMNDVLLPLCERHQVNLVTGVGELSITACLELVRARMTDRPLRILYVSDFDPAGQSMPVAVARKVEYFLRNEDSSADVRLYPVVLSADQVRQYRLPRTPIKDTERRAGRFEERYGEGAVELDALEALYPGTLGSILEREVRRYFDLNLDARVSSARRSLLGDLERTRQAIITPHEGQLAQLRTDYEAIRQEFQARVEAVQTELTQLWQAIGDEMEAQTPDIEDYPIPEADAAHERNGALYDSDRDYVEQIEAYKAFQGKVTP